MTLRIAFSRVAATRLVVPLRSFQTSTRLQSISLLDRPPLSVFRPLQQIAPTFYAQGENIIPLYEPRDFYSELKTRILSAKERIFIAALYIGHSEKELVDTLHTALGRSDKLQVHILIDGLRGTRASKGQSSATLLLSLVQAFPEQVKISLYHTPDLTGMLKKTLPQRFNEGIGLMHLKIYGFDDSVMLSGANLSKDYFTNRQDRYMMFEKHNALASYYHDLLDVIRSFSYQLDTTGKLVIERNTADPVRHSRLFKTQAHDRLVRFLQQQKSIALAAAEKNGIAGEMGKRNCDTAIFPVIQMGPLGIRQDEQITMALLGMATKDWVIHLTSGYFNFTDRYKAMFLRAPAQFRFLTASPEANGFFNSKGVSKYLPPAYTWIEKQFYTSVRRAGRAQEITIEEYRRPGWTYHAKGLWATLTGGDTADIAVTMIGSPNFGHRSSERDLEAQALVITENTRLQEALHKEVQGLHSHAQVVNEETFGQPERQVPYGVRAATAMIKTML